MATTPEWHERVAGLRPPRLGSLARFGAASIASTVVTLIGLGALLQWTALPAMWANVVATSVGTLVAYELNRRWVWEGERQAQRARDLLAFWALSIAGMVISTLAVEAAGRALAAGHIGGIQRTLDLQMTNLAAFGMLTILKFLLSRSLFGSAGGKR
jgi:putative flippase GtrA